MFITPTYVPYPKIGSLSQHTFHIPKVRGIDDAVAARIAAAAADASTGGILHTVS